MTSIQYQTLPQRRIEAPRVLAQVVDGIIAELARLPRTLLATLLIWQRRAEDRRHLATLDPRLLIDMGISEAAAARESAIPFWRLE